MLGCAEGPDHRASEAAARRAAGKRYVLVCLGCGRTALLAQGLRREAQAGAGGDEALADEYTHAPFKRDSVIPDGLDWPSLFGKDGTDLESHYRHILEELGKSSGLLGVIFRKAQNKVQDPAKLRRLLELINEETWVGMDMDVKGKLVPQDPSDEPAEELLERIRAEREAQAAKEKAPRKAKRRKPPGKRPARKAPKETTARMKRRPSG